jgi:succinyl-CoA synthetase alpha subunit
VRAREAGLTFIKLDGDVGCCVNGAGLAMATMDLVKYYGGDPANFLDIGGSSNPEKVVNALRIITSDPGVKVILFNIFGGITRCDDVANGIVTATRQIDIQVPIVIRLTGTNEEEGGRDPRGRRLQRDDRHGRGGGAGRRTGKGRGQVSIFIDKDTRLVVQGITGRDGSFHTRQMIEYGTQVVAGVTPGKGGQTFDDRVPIFNTVEEAVPETGANTSVIYVPPAFAADAMFEAADAGVEFIVCITEGVPVLDMTRVRPYVRGEGRAAARAQLPRPDLAREEQGGDHPRPHHAAGAGRAGLALRDAHLRGGLQAEGRRHRHHHLRRHRRRPDQRHQLHRLPGGLRGRPGDRGDRDDRRDRRHRRAGGRALREGEPDQAGGRLHRGPDGASGRRMGHAGAIISGSAGTAEEKIQAFRTTASAWPSARSTSSDSSRRRSGL